MADVRLTTDDFGARRDGFGKRDQPVSFERQDEVGQNVSGKKGG